MRHLAVLCLLLSSLPAMAATIIDIKARGMGTRLVMDDEYARVDNSADGSYLLLHRPSEQSYLVLPETRQVMKLDDDSKSLTDSLKVELIPQKPTAQKMFGYPVQRYRIMSGRRYCGDVFASRAAMQDLDVTPMLDAAAAMIERQLSAMGPYAVVINQCLQASMTILSHADSIGLPLRMFDARGKLLSDVTNIDTKAVLASNDLTFPADYEEVASTRELSPFKQAVKQVRQHSPQVNQFYDHIDRFGQHLQDRYRQYWQRPADPR